MRFLHHASAVILQLRSFLAVVEEGSLHRAARRLNLSQSALSRQMQALEHELGGKLLERSSTGVQPTHGGHALAAKMGSFLAGYDAALLDVRRLMRGESGQLRIGYLASAFQEYLDPALRELRKKHPTTKVRLLDLFPGEQIDSLRRGEIDVGLTEESGELLRREFHTRRLAVIGSVIALPASHPLASRKEVKLAELKAETFICGNDEQVPGFSRRLTRICRNCGKFKPKILATSGAGISDAFSLVANEDAVALIPAYMHHRSEPGVAIVRVADAEATWSLFVVWQRGKTPEALRTLLEALPFPTSQG